MVHCASCDRAMIHTYAQKKGKPLYRYYVCGKAHRQGWQECETRSVSAPVIEQAVIERLALMAADTSATETNPVRLALDCAAASWVQLTEQRRQTLIRSIVQQVSYDGRTGNVTIRFDNAATDGAANQIKGDVNGNNLQ